MSLLNDRERTIIIGDVHGCIDELKLLLSSLEFNKQKDRLIFAGDLVDRGPDSGAVVRFIRLGGYECVCGNHDDKQIRYHEHFKIKNKNPQYKIPVRLSDDKKRTREQLSEEDLEWMAKLPKKIYIEKYNLLVVHAGVMPYMNPLHQPDEFYMYCRYIDKNTYKMMHLTSNFKQPPGSVLWANVYNGEVNIVYGHNVYDLSKPHIRTNKKGYKTWGLDTGCVFGGHLTAIVFKDNEEPTIHQIKAAKVYYKKQ